MKQLLFRNPHPLYGWIFSICWSAIAVAVGLTFVLQETVTADPLGALISICFLLLAPWMVFQFFKVPMISIWQDEREEWLVVRRWAWKVDVEYVEQENLPVPTVEEESDGDGGKRYVCVLRVPSGAVEFGIYYRRERAERTCGRMIKLLSGHHPEVSKASDEI